MLTSGKEHDDTREQTPDDDHTLARADDPRPVVAVMSDTMSTSTCTCFCSYVASALHPLPKDMTILRTERFVDEEDHG
jgi:hypothetical protein